MKILLIIPAYNESENIQRVVDDLRLNYPQYDYIVVNDGSRDNTAEICLSNGYHLLDLPMNLGLSGAFQTGVRYASENGYEAALQFDGDGQHDAGYIAAMVETMEQQKCDIVIGSRFCSKKKPRSLRMLGSRMISLAIRLTTGKRVKDQTSGMRLFNRAMIERFAQNINYGPEPDTISYLIHCGAQVSEVQVEMHERIAGASYLSMGRSVRYMINMFVSIVIDKGISSELLSFNQNLRLGTAFTVYSTSCSAFQEKAERLIVLEDYRMPADQMESLKAYR